MESDRQFAGAQLLLNAAYFARYVNLQTHSLKQKLPGPQVETLPIYSRQFLEVRPSRIVELVTFFVQFSETEWTIETFTLS